MTDTNPLTDKLPKHILEAVEKGIDCAMLAAGDYPGDTDKSKANRKEGFMAYMEAALLKVIPEYYKVVFEFLVQIPTGHFLVRRRATLPFAPFIKMSYFPDNPKTDSSFIVNCVEWIEEKNEFYVGIENCIISEDRDSVDEYIKWWRSAGWTVNDDHVTRER